METLNILKDFLDVFNRIINKYNTLNKNAYDYGTGDLLHPSEIHMLTIIGRTDEQNITEISTILAVSKSAVSQIVLKLSKKGFVEKYQMANNEKSVLLKLTQKGYIAVQGYEFFKKDIFKELLIELEQLEPAQVEFLYSVMGKIDKHMDYKLEKYK